jgi:hypothetical protein
VCEHDYKKWMRVGVLVAFFVREEQEGGWLFGVVTLWYQTFLTGINFPMLNLRRNLESAPGKG